MKRSLQITNFTIVSALGAGVDAHRKALQTHTGGLRPCDFPGVDLSTWIGRVADLETTRVDSALSDYDCRNNRLAELCLQQDNFCVTVQAAVARYGAERVGVFMGTSTSGVQQTEMAYAQRDHENRFPPNFLYQTTQNMYSVADYIRRRLNLTGPSHVVSTACSSSAKVFAVASRYISAGLCDAAVVGGVDSLCHMTIYGFNSLQLVSTKPCRPSDQFRDGISIGEAAGLALLEPARDKDHPVQLLGYGESSDAYHMSSPHPEGEGAQLAMRLALQSAKLNREAIDYVNLHGTGTRANDAAEDKATYEIFGHGTPCSSTKGHTGHTLGAAGIVEANLCCIAIQHDLIPGTLNTTSLDKDLRSLILLNPIKRPIATAMSNSFGFGGNNICLIFGRPM